jgi:hypothetical protein
MSYRISLFAVSVATLGMTSVAAPRVHAGIVGFPIPGWQVNRADGASASPVNPPESITLTTTPTGQSRSAFFTTRQDTSQFQVDFTYTFTGSTSNRMGAAFVLHNRPGGAGAVAAPLVSGISTNFGYSDFFGNFSGQSIALSLESSYLSPGSSSTGVYTGGVVGGGSTATSPVVFSSGHPIDVSITYNGFLLRMSATDTVTGAVFQAPTAAINIPAIVGGDLAYVGFTGSTNNNAGTTQTFSNFSYAVPAPAALPVVVLAGIYGLAPRRRRSIVL